MRAFPLAAALLVLLAHSAVAQNQADPAITVTGTITPADATVPLGGTAKFDVVLTVTLANLVCQPGAVSVPVTLELKEPNGPVSGIAGTLAANVAVSVPAGNYVATSTGSGTGNSTFIVTVATTAPAQHDHTYNIVATGPTSVTGCSPVNPAAQATASVVTKELVVKTGAAPVSKTNTTSSSAAPTSDSTSKKSPVGPLAVQLVLLAALVMAARRK